MKKTILTFAMMLMIALAATAGPAAEAKSADSKTNVEFKGDSIVVTDGGETVTLSGLPELQKMRDKINDALNDTLGAGNGTTVEIGNSELSPEDIKYISDQWASVAKQMFISGSICLLGLIALVLFFRYLTRRRKYDVMEKAIMNNYPLNDLAFNESKNTAIFVPQPVMPGVTPQGQVPVGTPIDKTAASPMMMKALPNWRALMPAVKWIAWGALFVLFSIAVCNGGEDPFWPIGLVLILVGVCKGFILYKEQKVLQEAWNLNAGRQQAEPMREGIPVPPPMNDYNSDVSAND